MYYRYASYLLLKHSIATLLVRYNKKQSVDDKQIVKIHGKGKGLEKELAKRYKLGLTLSTRL